MASLKLENVGKKAAWVYPEVQGTNPPERWGHSACFSQGTLYVFGGCRGGLHFSDVMSLDLTTMSWSSFACSGQQPGTRDSHTAVLHGRKMMVFGGTNGSKKINDVHILDLDSHVWSSPSIQGPPPPARESHSATLVDGDKVVIFGGTGEGEGNYLNDVHILELERMRWVSPAVKGELPVCRDSHTAVAVKDQLIVYGGDCGDRYLSEVDVFNLKTFTWSKIDTGGASQPAVRAGHVAVAADNKVYVFGGVGDRAYYNDVWVLDLGTWKWSQIEVAGLQPQGRFSHVAALRDDDITIYGGCGEDERPLDEVLVLHLGLEHLNADFPKCKFIQTVYDMERRKPSVEVINDDGLCDSETKASKDLNLNKSSSCQWKEGFLKLSSPKSQGAGLPFPRNLNDMADKSPLSMRARARKLPFQYMEHLTSLENGIFAKKRKTSNLVGRLEGVESEQDEASPTMSQHSSPTLSDQDKACPISVMPKPSRPPAIFLQHQQQQQQQQDLKSHIHEQQQQQHHHQQQHHKVEHTVRIPTLQLQLHLPGHHQTISFPVHESSHLQNHHLGEHLTQKSIQQQQTPADKNQRSAPNIVGSEVRGIVDGAFDSGYLMTAQINGQVFRGVLFCPGPSHAAVHRPPICSSHPKPNCSSVVMAAPPTSIAAPPPPSPLNGTLVGYPVHFSSPVAVESPGRATLGDPSKAFHAESAHRPLQIMGGRWVWQPSPPNHSFHHSSQESAAPPNLSIVPVPLAAVPGISLAPAPIPLNVAHNLTKNSPPNEPDPQPAVTLSLGQATHKS